MSTTSRQVHGRGPGRTRRAAQAAHRGGRRAAGGRQGQGDQDLPRRRTSGRDRRPGLRLDAGHGDSERRSTRWTPRRRRARAPRSIAARSSSSASLAPGDERTRPPCDNRRVPMDPDRKRKIRLVVALATAVLLATALVYTSFNASTEARSPSELLAEEPAGASEVYGKVVAGSVERQGTDMTLRDRRPRRPDQGGAGRLLGPGAGPVSRGPRGDRRRRAGRRHAGRREGQPDHEVPVEVRG